VEILKIVFMKTCNINQCWASILMNCFWYQETHNTCILHYNPHVVIQWYSTCLIHSFWICKLKLVLSLFINMCYATPIHNLMFQKGRSSEFLNQNWTQWHWPPSLLNLCNGCGQKVNMKEVLKKINEHTQCLQIFCNTLYQIVYLNSLFQGFGACQSMYKGIKHYIVSRNVFFWGG
jgi:hypothetical protein